MQEYLSMNLQELECVLADLDEKFYEIKSKKLKLNMSRGKPCKEQLDLSLGLLTCVDENTEFTTKNGTDCRNYGNVEGLSEARELFSEVLGVNPEETIISGSSSLNLMYDLLIKALLFGFIDSEKPWGKYDKIKFICPSPGYDRHFAICESLGIEMITVSLNENGPDMDEVERLVASDPTVKGIWCIPKFSNPEGVTYSDEVVDRLASMKTAANDFKIIWDNSYLVHYLVEDIQLKDILPTCKNAGNSNRVFIFSSTSKITFPGAGLAMMAASLENIRYIKKQMSIQSIGPDKINQLRHLIFLKNKAGIIEHMKKHAILLKPKFDVVIETFHKELGGYGIASWNEPKGGYFISFRTMDGCAKQVAKMALEAGVIITKAGASFPYGLDPKDNSLRIAPSFPPIEELKQAIELFCVCVKRASVMKLLGKI